MTKFQELHHRSLFTFKIPGFSPKTGQICTELTLLKGFEETLAGRMRKLIPKRNVDVVTFEWMKAAIESVCATHNEVKSLIADIGLPVSAWEDTWIEVYMNISVKLLDLCIAFTSEISRLSQGNIFVQCAVYNMNHDLPKQFIRARSSFDSWRQTLCSKNQRMQNCASLLGNLKDSLDLPKVKHSAKGKVLMSALYGLKVQTLLVCSVFATVFSGSSTNIMNVEVAPSPWSQAYRDLQSNVYGGLKEILTQRKVTILEELNAVDSAVKKLYPTIQDGIEPTKTDGYQASLANLKSTTERLSSGLDVLGKDIDGFFKIILSGRDELLKGLSETCTTDKAFGPYSKHLTVR